MGGMFMFTYFSRQMRKKKGFTLIELIVVIAILGILAAILIPRFTGFQDKARRTQVVTDAKQMATAVDSLLAESTSGTLDTAHGAQGSTTDTTIITSNAAIKLAGLNTTPLRIKSLVVDTDGGFEIKEEINSVIYTASRTDANTTVTITP